MERRIIVKRMHSKAAENAFDEYIPDPEQCLDIVEKLRQEAGNFIYGNTAAFQRTIKVVRKAQR
jgi:hypothetical protein